MGRYPSQALEEASQEIVAQNRLETYLLYFDEKALQKVGLLFVVAWWCWAAYKGMRVYKLPLHQGHFLLRTTILNFYMLEILMGKLSKILFNQILKKISIFVNSNILPGATAEVGLLYCACVHSNLEDSVVSLLKPMLQALTSSLRGTPTYNFRQNDASSSAKASLSPALETAINI